MNKKRENSDLIITILILTNSVLLINSLVNLLITQKLNELSKVKSRTVSTKKRKAIVNDTKII